MAKGSDFRSIVTRLWFRLITAAIVALVFSETLYLASGTAQGWTFYITAPEITFEVAVRLVAAALAGVALGTICTAAIVPFLWHFKSSRERLADGATKVAVVLTVFMVSRYVLGILLKWSYYWSSHRAIFDSALFAVFYVAFAVALCIPRARREVVTGLDGFLGEKITRRIAIATAVGTAALAATEYALRKTAPAVEAGLVSQRPNRNFLLVTFDALSAEDMSLYGHRLPTTPNIDSFASKGTVFSNFFSASTYTPPSMATIMTGMYPSETHVYQMQGKLRAQNLRKNLPYAMRAAGFATGAIFSNPYAYYLAQTLGSEYDRLPEPTFQAGGLQHLWDATRPLHQNSGFGSRIDEYVDLMELWNFLGRMPNSLYLRFQAVASFEQARQILDELPDGFFLWVHVMTPHGPYVPDAADRGRFLPGTELINSENAGGPSWTPHYEPDQQSRVDRRRLLYDEFVATADRAFGAFMAELENSGRLRDTTVIVSADHGESFEGGVYQHDSPYLTRPVIHIPLIIRMPDQQTGRTVAFTADQTSLAPTILDLAGVPIPDWMRGQSLIEWLNRDGQGEGEGLAFTQYFERNSVFKPLHHGSVGVIDGEYQYVVYLDTQKGALRPLSQAQIWNLDCSAEHPERAKGLRTAIDSRFPDLVQAT
jgi:arylsulfatase A-like enzyme